MKKVKDMSTFIESRNIEMSRSLRLEFSLSSKRNLDFIYEGRGSMKDVNLYIDRFIKEVNKLTLGGRFEREVSINRNIFLKIDSCFFEKCSITIKYHKNEKTYGTGGYEGRGRTLTSSGKLDCFVGVFDINGQWENVKAELSSMFAHELLHAYEDWMRMRKGGPSLEAVGNRLNYHRVQQVKSAAKLTNDWITEDIMEILYRCSPMERNAFVATLNQELYQHKDEIFDSKSAMEVLNANRKYDNFKIMGHNLQNMINYYDMEGYGPRIEAAFNKGTEQEWPADKILGYLDYIYNKTWRQVRSATARYMRTLYEQNEVLPAGMEDFTSEIKKRTIEDYRRGI